MIQWLAQTKMALIPGETKKNQGNQGPPDQTMAKPLRNQEKKTKKTIYFSNYMPRDDSTSCMGLP